MRLYFIRHGRQNCRLCNVDVPLAEEGRIQAALAGRRLSNYAIDQIYASDLLRAQETAQIIRNQFLSVGKEMPPVLIRPGLKEIDFGDLTGHTDQDIEKYFHDFKQRRDSMIGTKDLGFPGGEDGQDVWERVRPVLQEMVLSGNQAVVAVSHGGTIRVVLAALFGQGQSDRLRFVLNMENTSITEIYYDEEKHRFYLERVNDYAHLEGHKELLRSGWK